VYCVQRDINKCKITNWKERLKIGAGWKKSIKEAMVLTGLQGHLRGGGGGGGRRRRSIVFVTDIRNIHL
jgi:hypothetical protein